MPRRMVHDRWLFYGAGLLALGGAFLVGSASNYVALGAADDPSAFLWKHLLHLALGFFVLLVAQSFDYRRLAHDRSIRLLLLGTAAVLLLVLAMPAANGAHRWFLIGPFRFQPSELAKLTAIVFLAHLLARKEEHVNEAWAVPIPTAIVVGGLSFLVVIEPDLGSAVMLALVSAVMLFAAGLSWRSIGFASATGAVGFVLAVLAEPYRLDRIRGFLAPSTDIQGLNFQLQQSLLAVGRGGLTGIGLGQGQQKAFYLPAAHTDFIFSVVGEELGLLGTLLLLSAFLLLSWRGMRAALRAPDRFGFYLALGITHLLVLQALVNMGVCLGLLPTKGLPLPFISYGGSSLLMSMLATGVLLNVSQHSS